MTIDLERRALVQGGALLAAGAALVGAATPNPARAQASAVSSSGAKPMSYSIKPMSFDPKGIKGLSEKILVSHYENNYGGAVKRLNAISEQLAALDYAKAPVFVINGLKREELIAMNSMILHELYLRRARRRRASRGAALREAIARDFGSVERWRAEFAAMGKAQGGGSGWVLLTWSPRDGGSSTSGRPTTPRRWPAACRSSRSTCTSTPITWISARRRAAMSTPSCRRSAGPMPTASLRNTAARDRANGGATCLKQDPTRSRLCGAATVTRATNATPQNNRFHRIFEELAALGIDAEPAVYDEEFRGRGARAAAAADGVLVWVDPLPSGQDTGGA